MLDNGWGSFTHCPVRALVWWFYHNLKHARFDRIVGWLSRFVVWTACSPDCTPMTRIAHPAAQQRLQE